MRVLIWNLSPLFFWGALGAGKVPSVPISRPQKVFRLLKYGRFGLYSGEVKVPAKIREVKEERKTPNLRYARAGLP